MATARPIEIVAYRRQTEGATLRSWLQIERLTAFRAEAHITDGVPYAEIDFRYGSGPLWCIKVYAAEATDVEYLVDYAGDGEWVAARGQDIVDDDTGLALDDLAPLARSFCEMHFWNDEE